MMGTMEKECQPDLQGYSKLCRPLLSQKEEWFPKTDYVFSKLYRLVWASSFMIKVITRSNIFGFR